MSGSGVLAQKARQRARAQQKRLEQSSSLLPLEKYKNPTSMNRSITPQPSVVRPTLLPIDRQAKQPGAFDSAEGVFRSLKGGKR